jgi:integrase
MQQLTVSFGGRSAESIQPIEIERWLISQSEQNNWKPATANRFKALLSLAFRLGVENGKVSNNPARLVRRRREDNGRIRWLSQEEEKKLRTAIKTKFSKHMPELDIALNTGLRKGEQYRLTWECVNFERRILTIPRTKNGDTRHIPLNTTALLVFKVLHARSLGTGPVFPASDGVRLMNSRHWFDKAIKDAGILDFTWHCLRHTFASRLVMAGVDLRTVQELMGHKTIQMTCRYAHLAPQHPLAAVERLCAIPTERSNTKSARSQSKFRTRGSTKTAKPASEAMN